MDYDKVFLLLSIAEKALGFPQLKGLHDVAVAALHELLAEHQAAQKPAPVYDEPSGRAE